jgi:uncharacterized protein YajQ (UPF0234 family)
MASDYSFDISSDFDHQEMVNAVDQTRREIDNRFDFKGVYVDIIHSEKDKTVVITTESDYKLGSVIDILESKMTKRNLSLKILDKSMAEEQASGGNIRKSIQLRSGLSSENAKKISKIIREDFPKSKPVIQGEEIRVSSKSKDELQQIMTMLKASDFDLPFQFGNFR